MQGKICFAKLSQPIEKGSDSMPKPKTLRVMVRTFDMNAAGDDPESEKEINFLNRHDRQWLGKHCFWAMHQAKEVQTFPIQEGK